MKIRIAKKILKIYNIEDFFGYPINKRTYNKYQMWKANNRINKHQISKNNKKTILKIKNFLLNNPNFNKEKVKEIINKIMKIYNINKL